MQNYHQGWTQQDKPVTAILAWKPDNQNSETLPMQLNQVDITSLGPFS